MPSRSSPASPAPATSGWRLGDAAVITGTRDDALVVPEQSVVLRPAGKVVYVIVDGREKLGSRWLKPAASGGTVEIVQGCKAETIALDGAGFLTQRRSGRRQGPPPAGRETPPPRAWLSIKRHVLAWMLNAVLVLSASATGASAWTATRTSNFPWFRSPPPEGRQPDIVDASITNIIESSVNSTRVSTHPVHSSPGVSVINITFNLEKKIDVAFNEVQAKVNQVLRRLPDDVDRPSSPKVETNAQPIMWLALQGDRTAAAQPVRHQHLKKRLETIDGVGEVRLGGRRDRTIRVELLPTR